MKSDKESWLKLAKNKLPEPGRLRKLIGPSFIILGLGLGSGEVILWPYLSSNYGLGIIWGALIGITIQFFVNMEVERYALVNGESIFVGFARFFRLLPLWFIFSTFIGFGWPGIGLAGATLLSQAIGLGNPRLVAVLIFVLIGVILSIGKVLYHTVESLQKLLIGIGVPFIFLLTLYLMRGQDLVALGQGLVGIGDGFNFLPEGIILTTFLGALAYSGAGGNLNLAQSFYVRDKGYGMGAYAQKIKSIFRGDQKADEVRLAGTTFECDDENLSRFQKWWRMINLEHLFVFWLLGLFTMLLLALLAYTTTHSLAGNESGINFVLNEASVIGMRTFGVLGTLFLVVTGTMLSATQLTVLDSTSRIITENFLLMKKDSRANVSKTFYIILWVQILFGIIIFLIGFDQPLVLITLGAVLNAFAMFVYIGLILILNNRVLEKPLRPSLFRNLFLLGAWVFFGLFSYLVVADQLSSFLTGVFNSI